MTPDFRKRAKYIAKELNAIAQTIADQLIRCGVMPNSEEVPERIQNPERLTIQFLLQCKELSHIKALRPDSFTSPSVTTLHGMNLLELLWQNTDIFIVSNYGEDYEGVELVGTPFPRSLADTLSPSMLSLVKLVWDIRESCSSCIDWIEQGSVEIHE